MRQLLQPWLRPFSVLAINSEVIAMGILPPVGEWGRLNPHLK